MTKFVLLHFMILFFAFTIFAFAEGPKNPVKTPHHYVLAHVALRQICMANPVSFFRIMASQNRDNYLDNIWQQVRKNCDKEGEPSFSIKDVKVETTKINEFPTILITMPTPQFMAETHIIGIVLRLNVKNFIENKIPEKPVAEYFTLEKGFNLDDSERTVFCKWDETGKHLNYGTGPNPMTGEFIKAISKMLN